MIYPLLRVVLYGYYHIIVDGGGTSGAGDSIIKRIAGMLASDSWSTVETLWSGQ